MLKDYCTLESIIRVLRIGEDSAKLMLNNPANVDAFDLYMLAEETGVSVDTLLDGEFIKES